MISEPVLMKAIGKLMAMPYFPVSENLVKLALLDELPEIVENDQQLDWLIRRVTHLYKQWPGLSEIRAVYCWTFKPRDGVNVYSGVYPDGIPSERPAAPLALPPARATTGLTADPEFEAKVRSLAALKKMPGRVK